MDSIARRRPRRAPWGLLAGLSATALLACSGGDPPYTELPLRDALTADPEVLAGMTGEARRVLAERFEEARLRQQEAEPVAGSETAPGSLVFDIDDARAARGDDALVAASVKGPMGTRAAQPLSARLCHEAPAALPALVGGASAPTAYLEQSALRGHAGAVLEELVHASGAKRLVRVTAWPVGAAAVGDAVYVNASWLVALSPEAASVAPSPIVVPLPAPIPTAVHPLSLSGNPYLGYGSLEACTSDVTQRCDTCNSGGSCDAHATLHDFGDGKAECAFLAQGTNRPEELCALALLSIAAVSQCVSAKAPTCSISGIQAESSALPEADAFLADTLCTTTLDACLSGATAVPQTQGCQDPCKSTYNACENACSSKSCNGESNQSCGSSSSCHSTAGSSGCNSNNGCGGSGGSSSSSCNSCSGSGGGSSSSSSGACKCQTPATPQAPLVPLAWLMAPLAYTARRTRRRS